MWKRDHHGVNTFDECLCHHGTTRYIHHKGSIPDIVPMEIGEFVVAFQSNAWPVMTLFLHVAPQRILKAQPFSLKYGKNILVSQYHRIIWHSGRCQVFFR
jgi:hypothetical protein